MKNTEILIKKTGQTPALALNTENVKKYLSKDANDNELALFVELCIARNLNPFIKEAYLVVYVGRDGTRNVSITVSKDVFVKRAEKKPDFNGFKAGVIVLRKNELVYQEGAFKLSADVLVGGWAEVYKKGVEASFREEVTLDEYSSGKSMWAKKPLTMIRKVALVHALREAYADDFSGMNDESELACIQQETGVNENRIEMPTKKKELIENVFENEGGIIRVSEKHVEAEKTKTTATGELVCSVCQAQISPKIYEGSLKYHGKVLCWACQTLEKTGGSNG